MFDITILALCCRQALTRWLLGLHLAVLLLAWPLSAATALRVGITDEVQPPFARMYGDLNQGIVPDIYRLLLSDSGYQFKLTNVARQQVGAALLAGRLDLYCHSSPRWLTTAGLSWSPALMRVRDMLVTRQPYDDLASFEQQYTGRISTVKGYNYVEINQQLLAQRRRDAATPTQMLQAFVTGSADAAIVSEALLTYYQETQTAPRLALYDNALHCAYAPSLDSTLQQQLNTRIIELAKTDSFQLIYHSYTGKGQLVRR